MIQVSIDEIHSGQTLARPIFGFKGEILLAAGFKLSPQVLGKLRENNQKFLWVHEVGLESIVHDDLVSENTKYQLINELYNCMSSFRERLQELYKEHKPEHFLKNPENAQSCLNLSGVRSSLRDILAEMRKKNALMVYLSSEPGSSMYYFQHAVDSCLTSVLIGRSYGYSASEIEDLALGTLVMDIGYWLLPEELLNKSDRLTFAEFCLMKEHPNFGFHLLKTNPKCTLITAHIALQHHERQDGGGYPARLQGTNDAPLKRPRTHNKEIQRFAEVAAVASRYVELRYPRDIRQAKTPMSAIKYLMKSAGSELNAHIVDTLITLIPLYSSGTRIKIVKDPDPEMVGCTGVVFKTNPEHQDRPGIILLYDNQRQRMQHYNMDLTEFPDTYIEELLPTAPAD